MSIWKRLRDRLFAPVASPDTAPALADPVAPAAAPVPAWHPAFFTRANPPEAPNDGAQRARVFDPALKHHGRALRAGDPSFDDETTAQQWAHLRRLVTDHVLRAIAESEYGDRLILRGSRLLKAWVGGPAREPGDLDWVVDPPSVRPDESWGAELCNALVAAVFSRHAPPGVELVRDAVSVGEIWTYERAEGRRVVFQWRAAGLPGGTVQVDVVFRETLAEPDRRISIPAADGGCVSVRAATPAQSLAWKIAWLATDWWYPQGKDLYDAVLLAERFPVPAAVLDRSLEHAGTATPVGAVASFVPLARVDWDNFLAEYPWVRGTAKEWHDRLAASFRLTDATSEGESESDRDATRSPASNALAPEWLTSDVLALARHIDSERAYDLLPILADALQEAGCDSAEVLEHCRGEGSHVRGCWAVDLVLGKS